MTEMFSSSHSNQRSVSMSTLPPLWSCCRESLPPPFSTPFELDSRLSCDRWRKRWVVLDSPMRWFSCPKTLCIPQQCELRHGPAPTPPLPFPTLSVQSFPLLVVPSEWSELLDELVEVPFLESEDRLKYFMIPFFPLLLPPPPLLPPEEWLLLPLEPPPRTPDFCLSELYIWIALGHCE